MQGSIFLEDSSSTPDSIVSVGSYAAVLVNSSSINIYDAVSAKLLKKLTISSLFSTLGKSKREGLGTLRREWRDRWKDGWGGV